MEEGGKKKTITDAVELFFAVNAIAKRNGVGCEFGYTDTRSAVREQRY